MERRTIIDAVSEGTHIDFKPVDTEPTEARPGSVEKVERMAQRVLDGEEIFHDGDKDGAVLRYYRE